MLFLSTTQPDQYKIVEIDRVVLYSGKSGKEVRETWKAMRGGQEVIVSLSPYHLNVAGTRFFKPGDTVKILGHVQNGRIQTTISDVEH